MSNKKSEIKFNFKVTKININKNAKMTQKNIENIENNIITEKEIALLN